MNARKQKLEPEFLLCNVRYLGKMSDQQEKSMMGQRTRFLALHRHVDQLNDSDLKERLKIVNKLQAEYNVSNPEDTFTDINILTDVLHHEISLRDGYSVEQLNDIRKSYLHNVRTAEDFQDVTSEHMISIIENKVS